MKRDARAALRTWGRRVRVGLEQVLRLAAAAGRQRQDAHQLRLQGVGMCIDFSARARTPQVSALTIWRVHGPLKDLARYELSKVPEQKPQVLLVKVSASA